MNAQKISNYLTLYKEYSLNNKIPFIADEICTEDLIRFVEGYILDGPEKYHTFSPTERDIVHYLKERQASTGISNSSIAALLGVTEKELETQLKFR